MLDSGAIMEECCYAIWNSVRTWEVSPMSTERRPWCIELFEKNHKHRKPLNPYQLAEVKQNTDTKGHSCLTRRFCDIDCQLFLEDLAVAFQNGSPDGTSCFGRCRDDFAHCDRITFRNYCRTHEKYHSYDLRLPRLLMIGTGMISGYLEILSFLSFNYVECSHLCGVHYCVCPAHLLPESITQNLSREDCHRKMRKGKSVQGFQCFHDPPCINWFASLQPQEVHTK